MKLFHFIKKRSVLLSIIFFLFLIVVSFGIKIKSSKALLGFGGMITYPIFCTCAPGTVAVPIGSPTPGYYLYTPATIVHKWNMVTKTGSWLLGTYSPGGTCLLLAPIPAAPCVLAPLVLTGTMIEVGTSL